MGQTASRTLKVLLLFGVISYATAALIFLGFRGSRTGAVCSDGWHSAAKGRGACSHHGGVARWIYAEPQEPIRLVRKSILVIGHAGFVLAALLGLGIYIRMRLAARQHEKRLEALKQSGIPERWVIENLGNWDQADWGVLWKRVECGPFWPLRDQEVVAYVERLRDELQARRESQCQHENNRNPQPTAETMSVAPVLRRSEATVACYPVHHASAQAVGGKAFDAVRERDGTFVEASKAGDEAYDAFVAGQLKKTASDSRPNFIDTVRALRADLQKRKANLVKLASYKGVPRRHPFDDKISPAYQYVLSQLMLLLRPGEFNPPEQVHGSAQPMYLEPLQRAQEEMHLQLQAKQEREESAQTADEVFASRFLRVVDQVVTLCRPKRTLQLKELWVAIELEFTTVFGSPPTAGECVAIELEVIERRFDESEPFCGSASETTHSQERGGGVRWARHSALEDTSPWQDNAIRALEGD